MILFPCVSPRKWLPLFVRNALTMVLHRHRLSSRRSSSSCSSNGVAVLLQYRLAKSPLLSQILCLYSCHSYHKSTVISIELRRTFSTPQNRLKQGIQAYNKPHHRVLLRKSDPATLNMAVEFFIIRWYN
nr:MAG TPA: hypothetical protein [Caudoviricetes sp.]